MDYYSLPRKELQALCKEHGLRANTTNAAMAEALQSLNIAQDSEIRTCDAVILNAGLNSPASVTTSCRRTPLRTSSRSMVRTTRSRREPEKAEEELKSPAPGGIDNLEEASRSVALSGRRIMTRSSARREMKKIEIAEELVTPAKAVASLVPTSRRRPTRVSARKQTLEEGAEQEEAKGEKEVIDKLRTPSLSSRICTRRSSRLRGNNQDSEAKQLEQKLEKKFIDERGMQQPNAAGEPDQEAKQLEQKLEKKFIDERGMQQPDAEGEPDQEISEELLGEPSITIQETSSIEDNISKISLQLVETPAPVSEKYKEEPSGQTMTQVPGVNGTTCLLKQSDQNDGAVGERLTDAGVPPCSDIPTTIETSVASNYVSELFPQPEKVIIDVVSASLMDVHGELPSSEADQVAVTCHEASNDAVTLSVEVSDEAQAVDQTTGALAELEKEKPHQAHALEAGDGHIAQEASHNPVLPLPSEPENNVGESLSSVQDCDAAATDEVLQFPGTAVTSHEASTDAIMLPVEISDEPQVVDPITGVLADLEKENLHQEHALEAGDGFIAQEASLNPVLLLLSEPENNIDEPLSSGKDSDNVPAADQVLQFAETASKEEVPSSDLHHDPLVRELIATSAAVILDEFSDEVQQIEEVNEKRASLGSWSAASPFPASLVVASPGPEFFMVPAADKSLQFPGDALKGAQETHSENTHHDSLVVASPGPEFFMVPAADKSLQFPGDALKGAQETHSEKTHHDSLAVDLIATTTAVPDEVSGAFQQIEEANEKSPSFGSWSATSPGSEFSMVRKSGKSRSSVGSCKGKKALARIQMFTSAEACVDKENKLMNEENIVVDTKLSEKNVGLAELKNFSLRKLRIMVKEKEGIKNKVQMNERTPLETLPANCLPGNENREIA